MHDAYLARIVDAAASLAARGEVVSMRNVARESGMHHKSVWRRWSKLAVYELEPTAEHVQGYGLGERHDDQVKRRVALVRAAKAARPMLAGVEDEVLRQILEEEERGATMTSERQYDRIADDWSIGCSDENAATPDRLAWTPDGPSRQAPIRDGRRRYLTGRQYVGCVSNPPPRKATKERPVLTLAQQAVRDYRRAWRRIAG